MLCAGVDTSVVSQLSIMVTVVLTTYYDATVFNQSKDHTSSYSHANTCRVRSIQVDVIYLAPESQFKFGNQSNQSRWWITDSFVVHSSIPNAWHKRTNVQESTNLTR